MKTLPELLRDADPLGYEPPRNAMERRISRQGILDTPHRVGEWRRRRFGPVAVAALLLIAIGAGARYWSQVAVDVVAAVRFEVRLAEDRPADGLREAVIPDSNRKIYLHPETVVTNSDIAQAQVIQSDATTFGVSVTLNADGAAKLSRASQGHVGRPVAILIDGEVVLAPVVRAAINTSAIISGSFTKAEAERVVAGILGR